MIGLIGYRLSVLATSVGKRTDSEHIYVLGCLNITTLGSLTWLTTVATLI